MGIYQAPEAAVADLPDQHDLGPADIDKMDLLKKTGLSINMTNLSICTSNDTVNSRSALMTYQHMDVKYVGGWDSQDLQEVRGMFICLSQETKRKYSHGVMTP